MYIAVGEFNLAMSRPWRILLVTLHTAQAPALRVSASFSQERMSYIPEESRVIYQSKEGKEEKIFDALEWPRQKAAGCKHSPAMLASS